MLRSIRSKCILVSIMGCDRNALSGHFRMGHYVGSRAEVVLMHEWVKLAFPRRLVSFRSSSLKLWRWRRPWKPPKPWRRWKQRKPQLLKLHQRRRWKQWKPWRQPRRPWRPRSESNDGDSIVIRHGMQPEFRRVCAHSRWKRSDLIDLTDCICFSGCESLA